MKVCNGGEKMRNACVHQGENERRERTRTTYFSSIKRVTRPFHVVVVQKNLQKKCAARAKLT